jgi:hypothetical protein
MRSLQFVILCLILVSNSYSQTTTNSYGQIDVEITKEKRPKKVYAKVEIRSAFIGGDSLWIQSFETRLNQSLQLNKRLKKGKYIVSVAFVLAKDGRFSDIRCLNDPGFEMCQEVKNVLIKGAARWEPAAQGGHSVSTYRRSAITYPDSTYRR